MRPLIFYPLCPAMRWHKLPVRYNFDRNRSAFIITKCVHVRVQWCGKCMRRIKKQQDAERRAAVAEFKLEQLMESIRQLSIIAERASVLPVAGGGASMISTLSSRTAVFEVHYAPFSETILRRPI